ncbi:hypothetical protein PROFUN_07599 [Planoprotostelium fungivorum]|uniref:Uncharacterized protein n=1 Tax=Planoprotostelium fungivorum TaxID=1890364 RepID=A0A2P6NJZ9_9EUKA|nr:hypothetical protein PROFUN_07599 [Planoprotostelium fungivorum]
MHGHQPEKPNQLHRHFNLIIEFFRFSQTKKSRDGKNCAYPLSKPKSSSAVREVLSCWIIHPVTIRAHTSPGLVSWAAVPILAILILREILIGTAAQTKVKSNFSSAHNTTTNMTDSKRTHHQKDCRGKYTGSHNTHASHVISAAERSRFRLPNSNDAPSNYRNNNAATNQSVNQSSSHSMSGGSLNTNAGYYVPAREVQARIEHKIEVAKENEDMNNERYRNFLKKAAGAYGIDQRTFNGYH